MQILAIYGHLSTGCLWLRVLFQVVYNPGQLANVTWSINVPHDTQPGVRIALRYAPSESFVVLNYINNTDYSKFT
eukprot:COSAG02_NODE_3159_length_7255_cov_15.875629_6_plen_75_part_00